MQTSLTFVTLSGMLEVLTTEGDCCVTQCENGHSLCWGCCKKLKKACPSCEKPVGSIRNRTVERIMESVEVSCKNAPHGCKELLKISGREVHEEVLCEYRPFRCPAAGCVYKGSTLTIPKHLTEEHHVKTVESNVQCGALCIRMQPADHYVIVKSVKHELFLLHRLKGREFSDTFFCTSFGAQKRSYDITVTHGIHSRVYSMSKVLAHNIRDWMEGVHIDWMQGVHIDTLIFPRRPGVLRGYDVFLSDLQSQHKDSDTEEDSAGEEECEPADGGEAEDDGEPEEENE